MTQSKALDAIEAAQKSSLNPAGIVDEWSYGYIQPVDGVYKILPINCTGDYVAIAPLQRPQLTEGGIAIPSEQQSNPDIGIILGLGPEVEDCSVGDVVKFITKFKAASLTEDIPFYGRYEINVFKEVNVVAVLYVSTHEVVENGKI